MRRAAVSIVFLSATSWIALRAYPQNCPSEIAGFIACSKETDPGKPESYDDSISDLAYRENTQQVWAIEGPNGSNRLLKSRFSPYNGDLARIGDSQFATFNEGGFGIAEVPGGHPFPSGKFYILVPDMDLSVAGFTPAIGVMDESRTLIPEGPFLPIIDPKTGKPPPGYFTGLDANSIRTELAISGYEKDGTIWIAFLEPPQAGSQNYPVVQGPFKVFGFSNYYGGGIAYNGDSTVLVLSQFRSTFEGYLALEYDTSGVYTGRAMELPHSPFGDQESLLPIGIDMGIAMGFPALFVYNASVDALYAVSSEPQDAPAPMQGLDPVCSREADGRVRLGWTNDPSHPRDAIAVRENGVLIAMLPADATEYLTPQPIPGKYVFCLETLSAGAEKSPVPVCCEGQNNLQLPFLPPGGKPGSQIVVDPDPKLSHFAYGIACPKTVEGKEDFRMYVIGTYDNNVRVADINRTIIAGEEIATQPHKITEVVSGYLYNFAASGIALIDLTIDGQKVPMYILLDPDGENGMANPIPSASIHFLKDTLLPGSAIPVKAGTRYKEEIAAIDFNALQPGGLYITSWDSIQEGDRIDLITLDFQLGRLIKIRYNPASHTLTAVGEADHPLKGLTPFTNHFIPEGVVSVLPNGLNYLIFGGTVLDSTIPRAYLTTAMDDSPSSSVGLIGSVDGLYTFGQFYRATFFGWEMGPGRIDGAETVFFKKENVGALYYTLPNYGPLPNVGYWGSWLTGLSTKVSDPNLRAEQLFDQPSGVGPGDVLDSYILSSSFTDPDLPLDYHVHVLNVSSTKDLKVTVKVLLEGLEVPAFPKTDLSIPPGLEIYRVLGDRKEKSIQVLVTNLGNEVQQIRLIIGVTGVPSIPPPGNFRRGDADQNGEIDLTDAVNIVWALFLSRDPPYDAVFRCLDAADPDDSGEVDINDPVYIVNWLFFSGPEFPLPGNLVCGPDQTVDALPACDYTCR